MIDKLLMIKDQLNVPVQTIASEMGVSRQTIYRMLQGQAWTPANEERFVAYVRKLREVVNKL